MVLCKPWSERSPESHYIIVRNGTSTSDRVWECAEGYEERQYTVGRWECQKINPTIPQTQTVTIMTSRVSVPLTSTTTTVSNSAEKQGLSTNEVAAVAVAVVVFALIIVLLLCFWRRRLKLCFCKVKNAKNLNKSIHNMKTSVIESIDTTEDQVNTNLIKNNRPIEDLGYVFFQDKIITHLGYDKAVTFLKLLKDPSGKFNVENSIKSEEEKNIQPEIYLTNVFLDWMKVNPEIKIYEIYVEQALSDIGRLKLLRSEKENSQHQVNDVDPV